MQNTLQQRASDYAIRRQASTFSMRRRGREYGVLAVAAADLMRHTKKAWEVVDRKRQNPDGSIEMETKR